MDFCTLGMFIIDDIWYPPPKPPLLGIMGGAGSWAALGARLFRKPPSSELVGWVVHAGSDFPVEVEHEIYSWQTLCDLIRTPERLTTRGLNNYTDQEHRGFRYLTPKIRIDHNILNDKNLDSKTYHLICSAERCIELVQGILEKRKVLEADGKLQLYAMPRPTFVWEPVPDSCVPTELPKCLEALKYVDVLSPNLDEFAALIGVEIDLGHESGRQILERKCKEILNLGFGYKTCAVVVRLGEHGCYCAQYIRHTFFPAFHGPSGESTVEKPKTEGAHHDLEEKRRPHRGMVVDPTGGGNAFLGGFCVGLLTERHPGGLTEFEVACMYGSVAASFAIEQVGMPNLSHNATDGKELWNDENPHDRMREFQKRLNIPPLTEVKLHKASLYEPAVCARYNEQMIRKENPAPQSLHDLWTPH